MNLSIVVPVYNEEKNLPELYERIEAAMLPLGYPWDVTFVDDGSRDKSLEVLKSLQSANPDKVRVVEFRRNHGQTAAISAGIDYSKGDIVILMDADLQNDPADIPILLAKLDEGYDVVSGWRKDRQDNKLTRNLPSHIANGLISRSTGVKSTIMDVPSKLTAEKSWTMSSSMEKCIALSQFTPTKPAVKSPKSLCNTTHANMAKPIMGLNAPSKLFLT